MKLTEEQKQLLADAIATYDEVCLWKYSSPEQRKEMLEYGEKPPTREIVTEKMFLEQITKIVEPADDKATITTVGIVENGKAIGWEFDCRGEVSGMTFNADGTQLIAGYTIEELKKIADDKPSLMGRQVATVRIREAKKAILALLVEAELKGFMVGFDCYDYERLREYKATLESKLQTLRGKETT